MFGPVWSVKQWAVLGAAIGALIQLWRVFQLGLTENGAAYASGRLLGGAFVGAAIGAITATVRNSLAGK
jgi:hypothetical protein